MSGATTVCCMSGRWRGAGEAEARAKAAEARAEEFRCAEVRTRFESASWKHRYELSRRKLTRVVEQTKAIRGTANNAQSLQGSQHQKDTIKSLRTERGGLRKEVTRLNRDLTRLETRLARQTEKSETHKKTILRLYKEDVRLRRELRGLRDQEDVVGSLCDEVYWLRYALKRSEAGKEALKARLVKLRATGATLSKLPSGRGRTAAQGAEAVAAPEDDDQVTVQGERPAAQGGAGVAKPQGGLERGVSGGSCESGRIVEVAVRAQERATGQVPLGASARPAAWRSRPWPHPATGA